MPIAFDSRSSAHLRESARTGSVGNTMSAALLSCTIRARLSSATATGPAAGRSAPPPRCGRPNARYPECADARAPAPTQYQCNTGAIRMNQFNPALNRIPRAARRANPFHLIGRRPFRFHSAEFLSKRIPIRNRKSRSARESSIYSIFGIASSARTAAAGSSPVFNPDLPTVQHIETPKFGLENPSRIGNGFRPFLSI